MSSELKSLIRDFRLESLLQGVSIDARRQPLSRLDSRTRLVERRARRRSSSAVLVDSHGRDRSSPPGGDRTGGEETRLDASVV